MAMLLEQHSSSEVSGGGPGSRRVLDWAQTDILAQGEVSVGRRLAAWVALGITLFITLLLLLGA